MQKAKQLMSFQDFLTTQSINVDLLGFFINLLICCSLALILAQIYIKCAKTISNRKMFASNFYIITLTTMIIITVVKSSLSLSLGLVGALSIVRFRTAIKEPEELAYLFLCICIGLGLGANQRGVILIGFSVVSIFIIIIHYLSNIKNKKNANLYITVSHPNNEQLVLDDVVNVLNEHCSFIKLKRFDKGENIIESSYIADFKNHKSFRNAIDHFSKHDPSLKISVIDNGNLF